MGCYSGNPQEAARDVTLKSHHIFSSSHLHRSSHFHLLLQHPKNHLIFRKNRARLERRVKKHKHLTIPEDVRNHHPY